MGITRKLIQLCSRDETKHKTYSIKAGLPLSLEGWKYSRQALTSSSARLKCTSWPGAYLDFGCHVGARSGQRHVYRCSITCFTGKASVLWLHSTNSAQDSKEDVLSSSCFTFRESSLAR